MKTNAVPKRGVKKSVIWDSKSLVSQVGQQNGTAKISSAKTADSNKLNWCPTWDSKNGTPSRPPVKGSLRGLLSRCPKGIPLQNGTATENGWKTLFWSFGPKGEFRPPKDQPWMPTIWPNGALTWPHGVSSDKYDRAVEWEAIARAAYTSEGLFWDMDPQAARAKRLWELYRLTPQDHSKIFIHQGQVCAISKKPSKQYGTDHCHATGLIRGLIDWRINKGLAFFNDDPELLRAAADYLENPPATTALGAPRYGLIGRAKVGKRKPVYGPPSGTCTKN